MRPQPPLCVELSWSTTILLSLICSAVVFIAHCKLREELDKLAKTDPVIAGDVDFSAVARTDEVDEKTGESEQILLKSEVVTTSAKPLGRPKKAKSAIPDSNAASVLLNLPSSDQAKADL